MVHTKTYIFTNFYRHYLVLFTIFSSNTTVLRGAAVNRNNGTRKNLYIYLFLLTLFGPIYYCMVSRNTISERSLARRQLQITPRLCSFSSLSLDRFSAAVPCWGRNTHIPSSLSPKRDCGTKSVHISLYLEKGGRQGSTR